VIDPEAGLKKKIKKKKIPRYTGEIKYSAHFKLLGYQKGQET